MNPQVSIDRLLAFQACFIAVGSDSKSGLHQHLLDSSRRMWSIYEMGRWDHKTTDYMSASAGSSAGSERRFDPAYETFFPVRPPAILANLKARRVADGRGFLRAIKLSQFRAKPLRLGRIALLETGAHLPAALRLFGRISSAEPLAPPSQNCDSSASRASKCCSMTSSVAMAMSG